MLSALMLTLAQRVTAMLCRVKEMMKTHKGTEAEPASKGTSQQPLQKPSEQALPSGWESRIDESSGEPTADNIMIRQSHSYVFTLQRCSTVSCTSHLQLGHKLTGTLIFLTESAF